MPFSENTAGSSARKSPTRSLHIPLSRISTAGSPAAQAGIPYFVNVQGLGSAFSNRLLAPLVTGMYRYALKNADTVFFENSGNLERFVEKRVVAADRTVLLPGAGVDTDFYPYREYPSEENGLRFLFVGRIMKEKGVNELFAAAEKLKSEYGDKVHFDVAGFFEDAYSDRVKKLSDSGVITYLRLSRGRPPRSTKAATASSSRRITRECQTSSSRAHRPTDP